MTLYLTDTTAARRDAARARGRHRRDQALSGRRDDEQRRRRDRPAPRRGDARRGRARRHRLLVHGEVTDPAVDVFDREAVFIERQLVPLRRDFPGLRIVLEHITTREAAQYVAEAGPRTAATITAHHLLYNRNAIFIGGIRPHYYCLPVLKREEHRRALVAAATSGSEPLLPRHRQRAASGRAEGARERLRRLLHGVQRARAVRRGVRGRRRARPARGVRELDGPAFYGLAPQHANA